MHHSDASRDDARQKAYALCGGSQDLLRSAAKAVERAGTHHAGSDSDDSAEPEIRALAHFGRAEGLMLDAAVVAQVLTERFLGKGMEHMVGVLPEQRRGDQRL
ncbi:MAG: hypothetical protein ACO1TE_18735 [Prosthecobacter sp.]